MKQAVELKEKIIGVGFLDLKKQVSMQLKKLEEKECH